MNFWWRKKLLEKEDADHKRILELEKEVHDLCDRLQKNKEVELEIETLRQCAVSAEKNAQVKIDAVKREQTEADLILVSLKIIFRVLQGEKKENLQKEVSLQSALAQQSGFINYGAPRALREVQQVRSGIGDLLGSLLGR